MSTASNINDSDPSTHDTESIWSDDQRRTVWTLICKSRIGLRLELSPIIATAFVIMQNYFQNNSSTPYTLFTLMTAALFTSAKGSSCYRPIEMIHNELNRICKAAPSDLIRKIVGCNPDKKMDQEQLELVTQAELDLLQSIDFDMNIELPFQHFERIKDLLQTEFKQDMFVKICNGSIINMCLIICSKVYLDLAPELIAVASTRDALCGADPPERVLEWFENVRDRYGDEQLDIANQAILFEKSKTFQRQPQSPPPSQPNVL